MSIFNQFLSVLLFLFGLLILFIVAVNMLEWIF